MFACKQSVSTRKGIAFLRLGAPDICEYKQKTLALITWIVHRKAKKE